MSSKGDTRSQKQRGRERANEQESVTGIRPTQSGSSGKTLFMSRLTKRTFADIEADAQHVADVVAVFNDARKTSSRSMIVNLTVPGHYQHELLDMMDACAMGFVMIRCYYVPRHPFMPDDP
jgi:hypothetical protein